VGTWPKGFDKSAGPAIEAWKIDLKKLQFSPVQARVRCANQSYEGNDEGDDLAIWAKKRAAKRASASKPKP
jgi:hypothetical protein